MESEKPKGGGGASPHTHKAEAGGSLRPSAQGQPDLHSQFQAIQGYIVKSCLKTNHNTTHKLKHIHACVHTPHHHHQKGCIRCFLANFDRNLDRL